MENEPLLEDRGRQPQPQRTSKLLTVCPFILGNEFCERLAFYGLATNMVIYLTEQMGMDPGSAGMQVSLFEGTCYLTPLLGAWLADSHWGRFKTVLIFSIVYSLGMFGMAATAIVPGLKPKDGQASSLQLTIFYIALYVVAFGTGGIKPNVSSFGADQFDDKIKQERLDKQSFFNWFYFFINVGSLIACTVIVWIQGWDWGLGFGIPAIAMVLAIVLFVAGYRLYTHVQPTGSPLERVIGVVYSALKHRIARTFGRKPSHSQTETPSTTHITHQVSYQWLADAVSQEPQPEDDYDRAGRDKGYSAMQVEEVRMVVRMFPIFLLTILYWTIYVQMSTVFVLQGKMMDRNIPWINGETFEVPAASLTIFDTLSIIVLIPMYDGIINPIMRRCGCGFTMLQRIGWGMFIAVFAMLAGAYVERRRMAAAAAGSNIGVMEQATQYLLVGASEVLASIGQMEFFYDQAPDVMRSCCMALNLLSTALGGYVSALLMYLVDHYTTWLRDLQHNSRLDLFFVLLAGLMLANTLLFMVVAMRYKYKVVKHHRPLPRIGAAQQSQPAPGVHRFATEVTAPAPVASSSQAINITGRLQTPGYGYQWSGTPQSGTPDVGVYGRSVTYYPITPALPAQYR